MIVYPDGRLCISILHPPGDDPVSGEKAEVTFQPLLLDWLTPDIYVDQYCFPYIGTMEPNAGKDWIDCCSWPDLFQMKLANYLYLEIASSP